MLLGSSWFSA